MSEDVDVPFSVVVLLHDFMIHQPQGSADVGQILLEKLRGKGDSAIDKFRENSVYIPYMHNLNRLQKVKVFSLVLGAFLLDLQLELPVFLGAFVDLPAFKVEIVIFSVFKFPDRPQQVLEENKLEIFQLVFIWDGKAIDVSYHEVDQSA